MNNVVKWMPTLLLAALVIEYIRYGSAWITLIALALFAIYTAFALVAGHGKPPSAQHRLRFGPGHQECTFRASGEANVRAYVDLNRFASNIVFSADV